MRFDVITLFPELFEPFFRSGINRRAFESKQVDVRLWNPRDFAEGNYRRVDDRPFGGGPGMVMMAEPLWRCLQAIRADRAEPEGARAPVVLFSPIGQRLDHALAVDYSQSAGAVLVCGRYEGVDQRVIDRWVTHEISLGDFVLSGGELPALVLLDAVARLQPGVLTAASHEQDSFSHGLLEGPAFSRPEVLPDGRAVPSVLLSGHHGHIARWRREQALAQTARRRPDLIERAREQGRLDSADERFLQALGL